MAAGNGSSRGGNLPYGDFTSILINPENVTKYLPQRLSECELGGGVYHSTNAGSSWARIRSESRGFAQPTEKRWLEFSLSATRISLAGQTTTFDRKSAPN